MGAWGYGSGDSDGAKDWYPISLNKNDDIIPPTLDELNLALKKYLNKGKISKSSEKEEFLGVVILGLRDKLIASEVYLRAAYQFANELLIDKDYLEEWSETKDRVKALEKERKTLMGWLLNETPPKAKLTTGLFEALSKKTSSQKVKESRPSPSASATEFKVNTVKKGNDGNFWIVKKSKKSNVKRWIKQ